jgi:beige protein homolog 1
MKAETLSEDVLPHFLSTFENLVNLNYNAEVHRALALFITYAFHSPPPSLPRTPKPQSAISRSSTPGLFKRPTVEMSAPAGVKASIYLTKKQLGTKILGLYCKLLCDKGDLDTIKKFARTVTNKVGIYLTNQVLFTG